MEHTNTYLMAKRANDLFLNKEYLEAKKIYKELILLGRDHYEFNLKICRDNLGETHNKKSVIFVTAGIKGPTPGGGIATCFFNLATQLAQSRKAKVTILYAAHPYYSKDNYSAWKEYYKNKFNIDFIGLETNNKDYGSVEMKRSYAIYNFLKKNKRSYSKFIFHDFGGLAYYSLLAKNFNLEFQENEIEISAHGNTTLSYHFGQKGISHWSESAKMFMEKKSVQLADKIYTPSKYYAEWLKENFRARQPIHKPNIILNKKDIKNTLPHIEKQNKEALIFFGRFERLKGLDIFIDALQHLNNDKKNYLVIFAGNKTNIDGEDSIEYLKNRLNNTSHKLEFIVNTTPEEIFELSKQYNSLFIYPTLGETSSCVVVETILNNAAFLASDIPGIKELIKPQDQSKFLFKTGDYKDLADKIKKQLTSRNKHIAELSFDMKENMNSWIESLTKSSKQAQQSISQQQPLVSIIVPTCDRPQLLLHALISLKKQSYSNIEIIVIDDNSSEKFKNEKICKDLSIKYIYLSEKKYKGEACNFAVKKATGDYICFFDDDDLASPDMIKKYMIAFSSDSKIELISCFAAVFEHVNWSPDTDPKSILTDYTSLALGNSRETNFVCNFFGKGSFIIKKISFKLIGGYEIDHGPIPMVDYRFYIKASLNNLKSTIVPEALYLYRKNSPNSLFYNNQEKNKNLFMAKKSILQIFDKTLGYETGNIFSHHVWNISQPLIKP